MVKIDTLACGVCRRPVGFGAMWVWCTLHGHGALMHPACESLWDCSEAAAPLQLGGVFHGPSRRRSA